MLTLYPYQQKLFDLIISELKRSKRKRGIAVLPTGGGKTVVFSKIVELAQIKGSRSLILTDRAELLSETGNTLREFNLFPKYIVAGLKNPPTLEKGTTIVAMAQTLNRRIGRAGWDQFFADIDLIIIDECHKQDFNDFFTSNIFDGRTLLGFSATPKRGSKQRQLGEDYDFIADTITVNELIQLENLVPELYYGVKGLTPDMKGVRKEKGDYSENQMFKKYDSPKIYGGVVKHWKEHHENTSTLVFGVNISHCIRLVKEFDKNGIKAKFLVSGKAKPKELPRPEPVREDAPPEWVKYWEQLDQYNEYKAAFDMYSGERTDLIERWKGKEFDVLINAGILTTGFNHKALESIYVVRATTSLILWLQIIGRGSRTSPDKTHFNLVDFGGNAQRLGSYRLPRTWSLWHEGESSTGGDAPMKVCGEDLPPDKHGKYGCGDFIFASSTICPICGYIYPEKKLEKEAELTLMSFGADGSQREVKPIREMDYKELETFAKSQNYKSGWLFIQLARRGGEKEIKKYAEFKGYAPGWITRTVSRIPKHLLKD